MDNATALHLVRELHSLTEATERSAKAQEDLIALAKEERDYSDEIENQPGPPFCPHCSQINPVVITQAEGEGLLGDFVLVMQCKQCGGNIYGIPEGWQIAPDIDTAKEMREARKAGT